MIAGGASLAPDGDPGRRCIDARSKTTSTKYRAKTNCSARVDRNSPGQDHRLGANEAPPAIISIFLGTDSRRYSRRLSRGPPASRTPELVPRPGHAGAAAAADAWW